MSTMGTAQTRLLVIVAAVLLVATNRYAKQQRRELETLEPPASLDSVGTWEDEVRAAQERRAEQAAPEQSAPEQAAQPSVPRPPEDPTDGTGRTSY